MAAERSLPAEPVEPADSVEPVEPGARAAAPLAPPRPMRVRRWVARTTFRLIGWQHVGTVPRTGIILGAPHTSNWDLVLTVLVLWADGVEPRMLVKQEVFWWPLGALLRALGAIPTDRRGGAGLVRSLVAEAQSDQGFALVLAPDGTRTRTDHWKSGFYRLSRETGLPVTLGFLDGPTRTAGVGPTIQLTGDVRADMDVVRAFYADKHGVRPGRGSAVRLREEDRAG
ncbi:MAG TPA: 1-acyl-sn-glycerol-3-phosphate acyltransferase [Actinotalea sp.]|nr:1-acyl-sn-glycerol-3-phosphate acyltransferase [Actinotalea sp.]